MTIHQDRSGRLHSRDFIDLELYDPRIYAAGGIPHEALALLREKAPVCWVDEPAMFGWAEGPGYWLVRSRRFGCRRQGEAQLAEILHAA